MNRKTIAFIGGGNMGEAIISKMVSSDWKGDDIHVIDHNEEKLSSSITFVEERNVSSMI